MEQERRVGRAARDRPVHVVDREIGSCAAFEDGFDQRMIGGLVDIDRGERIGQLDRADGQAELAADRARASGRACAAAAPRRAARRPERRDQPPALLAVLLDRPPQLDRRRDLGRAEARTGWRRYRRRRETEPGALRRAASAPSAAARSTTPMARSAPVAPGAEIGDHRRVEQRMVGGRDQQRPTRRRIVARSLASVAAMVAAGRLDRQPRDRRAGRRRSGPAAGSAHAPRRSRGSARSARTGRAHHRLAADRDQRLQVGAMRSRERIAPGPRAGEHERGPAAHASQETIGSPRAACGRWPGPAARRGRSGDTSVHSATSSSPMSGRPNSSAATRITMFGLRRAVISRNWLSIGRQTWMCMPRSGA